MKTALTGSLQLRVVVADIKPSFGLAPFTDAPRVPIRNQADELVTGPSGCEGRADNPKCVLCARRLIMKNINQ